MPRITPFTARINALHRRILADGFDANYTYVDYAYDWPLLERFDHALLKQEDLKAELAARRINGRVLDKVEALDLQNPRDVATHADGFMTDPLGLSAIVTAMQTDVLFDDGALTGDVRVFVVAEGQRDTDNIPF